MDKSRKNTQRLAIIVPAAGPEPVRIESKPIATWEELKRAHAAFDIAEILREAETEHKQYIEQNR